MVTLALTALAAGASAAALVALLLRRSRRAVPRATPVPAGMQHLAATLTDRSDASIHLSGGRAGRPRLGSLLGLR